MSKKQKVTTEPSKFAQPYITGAASAAQNAYNQNQPQVQAISGDIQSRLPQLGQMAFGTNPGLDAAEQYNQSVLGGKFLDAGNPYMQSMIDQTNNDVADNVNSRFGMSGATGGIQNQQMMTREMLNAENGLRYGNYQQERGAMSTAAGQAPGLNQAQYAGVAPYLTAATAGAELPFTGTNDYASNIAKLVGNSQTQTSSKGLGAYLMDMLVAGANSAGKAAAAGGG